MPKRSRSEELHVLFAHGAGAPSTSPWMVQWSKLLETHLGATVHRFDYGSARFPPQTLARHTFELKTLLSSIPEDAKVIMAGKSMGARISCIVAAQLDDADRGRIAGVVCLGFPLLDQKGDAKARREVLEKFPTSIPLVLVQGTRDKLTPLDQLEAISIKAPCALLKVETGDHSLEMLKGELRRIGKDQKTFDDGLAARIADALQSLQNPP
eukprot:ANDGO_06746.mRNA.1 hypothetical protein